MKKQYTSPLIDTVPADDSDILTASGGDGILVEEEGSGLIIPWN